jgi:glycosyltransferase involved in cell wall biosynthesis
MFALALAGHGLRARAMAARLPGAPDVVMADLALGGVLRHARGALRVLHAHNVEFDHFLSAGPSVLGRARWAERLRVLERAACDLADVVVTVSDEDAARMTALHGVDPGRLLVVPNGWDEQTLRPPRGDERARARAALDIAPDARVAVFVGSDVPHNRAGLRVLLDEVARRWTGAGRVLIVAGGVARALPGGADSGGTRVIAVPEQPDLLPVLHAADAGLNPVAGGSGSNVKLPAYLAAGLAVVTTAHGLRGYADLADAVTVAEPAGFAAALDALALRPRTPAPALARYAWGALGARLGDALAERIGVRGRAAAAAGGAR